MYDRLKKIQQPEKKITALYKILLKKFKFKTNFKKGEER